MSAQWASEFLGKRPEWLKGEGPSNDVVLSSRVRLARNLAGLPFTTVATRDDRELVLTRVEGRLEAIKLGDRPLWVDLRRTDVNDGRLLVERQLISAALLAGRRRTASGRADREQDPRGVVASLPDERCAVMINEEDHIRIQSLRSGFDLGEALRAADSLDDALEETLDYAFHPRLGYLTACPTNIGTGARFSVMLHLPGLAMTGELERAKRAAHDMSLAVRGFYGEGTESSGDFYQISNQTTLGRSEGMLLDELARDIVPQIIEYERSSRRKLLETQRPLLDDGVHRALGLARSARLMSSEEAMGLLSRIRLGLVLGLIDGPSLDTVHSLMLLVQPAHLELWNGSPLDQSGRRGARASLMREQLG